MLTQQEIDVLKRKHSTELSALNAIVKLISDNPSIFTDIYDLLNSNLAKSVLPGYDRSTTSSTLNQDCYTFAVANVGNSTGTFLGKNIKKGETLNFGDASMNNYFPSGSFSWNATGTEFLIIYTY